MSKARRSVCLALRWLLSGATSLAFLGSAAAHHSYAMFDASKTLTVSGTVAKLEWMNPHVFVWVYVPDSSAQGGHALYAFENGSTNVLSRLGWSKTTFNAGDKVSVEYWPLKDGRTGGHFLSATYADGRVIRGAGGPDQAKAVPPLDGRKP
jgi:hypothetical protein